MTEENPRGPGNGPEFFKRQCAKRFFALADCNNFFVSCERLFRPDLRNRPVVVLSNNDGCVVSRSDEVKRLGVPMGIALFKVRDLIARHGVAVFSSNFPLYLDLSARVYAVLCGFAPAVERYSIDEAFLDLTGFRPGGGLAAYLAEIRTAVTRGVGIPVCVGAAPTKTLAKIANRAAKKKLVPDGVFSMEDEDARVFALKNTPLEDVWGVGRAFREHFGNGFGAKTAWDLSRLDPALVTRKFSVTAGNVVRELNGLSCIPLEEIPRPKKQIMWSRTFGRRVSDPAELAQIMAEFAARAGARLREDGQYAGIVGLFVHTNPFAPGAPLLSRQASLRLRRPTCLDSELAGAVRVLLDKIRPDGREWARGGVILSDLRAGDAFQTDLFEDADFSAEALEKKKKLQAAVDRINAGGRNTVFLAAQGAYARRPVSEQRRVSPGYTTRWRDVPKVR